MRRLTRLLAGRRANDERGAIAVLTATLVMFVAVGLLALTIDLGNITYNRAELQNGADATSLALAAACAQPSPSRPCSVTDSLRALARNNANASDQSMSILTDSRTCVANYTGTTTLPPCSNDPTTAAAANLTTCEPWPLTVDPTKVSYVEVTTQTLMKDGTSVLPFHFAQLLSGAGNGSTSRTCSRAAWGPAGSTGLTFPLTMGMCDWNRATSSGTKYAPAPPYTPGPSLSTPSPAVPTNVQSYTVGIYSHADDVNRCSDSSSGGLPNGGFAYITPGSSCVVTISSNGWISSDTGASVPKNGCPDVLQTYLGKVVSIPIFDNFSGSGSNGQYHIAGIASFYLAGWDNIPAVNPAKSTSVYKEPASVCTGKCNGSTTYFWGWFTTSLQPVANGTIDPSGTDLGNHVVVPAG
ncbi:pilus assembly protein TadG-related protein [Flexivirga sp.]|uniref:pilus assembly protein TadG-related protein n=1 Tax=Flexivirga sp. TaxID=1962927 RepID=UPI003F807090